MGFRCDVIQTDRPARPKCHTGKHYHAKDRISCRVGRIEGDAGKRPHRRKDDVLIFGDGVHIPAENIENSGITAVRDTSRIPAILDAPDPGDTGQRIFESVIPKPGLEGEVDEDAGSFSGHCRPQFWIVLLVANRSAQPRDATGLRFPG